MALASLFRRETPVRPPVAGEAQEPVFNAHSPDSNRLALLELVRAWEAARLAKPGCDEQELEMRERHWGIVLDRYVGRVQVLSKSAPSEGFQSAKLALAAVRSSSLTPEKVRDDLRRILNQGGPGSALPAA